MGACYPPAPEETGPTTRLIQKGQTSWYTIDLKLDCEFYTNSASGHIIRQGLIAAQDKNQDKQTDTFMSDQALKEKYSYYGKEKGKDKPDPWQINVTVDTFQNCQGAGSGGRKKRATGDVTFKVGTDSNCDGTDVPCNGPLKDGQDYSFRSFICTNGGCTLTLYSPPFSTEKGRPPTAGPGPDKNNTPVIAGAVSSVVILIFVIMIVVVTFKRRRFSKSREEENQNYEAINLDNMEGGETTRAIYASLNTDQPGTVNSNEADVTYEVIPADVVSQQPAGDGHDYMNMDPRNKNT